MSEQQPAEHLSEARAHRNGEIARGRQLSRQHSVVPRVLLDVIDPDDARAKGRPKGKLLEGRARRSGERGEDIRLPLLRDDAGEECAELRSGQAGRLVGDELYERLKITLADECLADAIDDLDVVSRSGPILFDHRRALRSGLLAVVDRRVALALSRMRPSVSHSVPLRRITLQFPRREAPRMDVKLVQTRSITITGKLDLKPQLVGPHREPADRALGTDPRPSPRAIGTPARELGEGV